MRGPNTSVPTHDVCTLPSMSPKQRFLPEMGHKGPADHLTVSLAGWKRTNGRKSRRSKWVGTSNRRESACATHGSSPPPHPPAVSNHKVNYYGLGKWYAGCVARLSPNSESQTPFYMTSKF